MKRHLYAAVVATLLMGTAPAISSAEPSTAPLFAFGLLGTYSKLEFTGGKKTDSARIPEGGIFLNFGNKVTAKTGIVYQAEISGKYYQRSNEKLKDGQADLDLGWRIALDERNFVDILLGGGYAWNRFQPDIDKYDIELTNRTPFAKVAAGYNHQFSNTTVRFEAGVRRAIDGDTHLTLRGISSESVDLKNSTNPFIELSFLFNQQGTIPVLASLYYNRFKYELDGQLDVSAFNKQTREEYGVKLGLAF